ncbi:MAG: L-lactate dehydrogenase [Balneolaceae bacterium]|nr:L-lactate dehydrogenase [Balneolaceae bacterium]MDR9407411.1 L-lactate dehydrogenase [Balneolaceae bacterium]
MKTKSVGIIGMGWVGSSVASSILQQGVCRELLLNDINEEIAEGEAMDLNHGSPFYPSANVKAATVEDMLECDAIVITAGRGGESDESRLNLLNENIKIVRTISKQLKGYEGILIVVSNPVDVITYYYQKLTGIPSNRVMGTGTMLDTARLMDIVGDKINVDSKSIKAEVIGEHGDSEVVLWSKALVGNTPLQSWEGWSKEYENESTQQVKNAAYEIIKRKGATNHAIGMVTATLIKWIMRNENRIITVSSVVNGAYGLNDVAISLPCLISSNGIERILESEISMEEMENLRHSASVIHDAINSVKS